MREGQLLKLQGGADDFHASLIFIQVALPFIDGDHVPIDENYLFAVNDWLSRSIDVNRSDENDNIRATFFAIDFVSDSLRNHFLPTQSITLTSAADKYSGCVPPAWAISARPPPFPPTCCATKLTSSPALI